MPARLDQVTITLWQGPVELPWDSRVQLVEEMSSIEGTEQAVRAFNAVGASAPVRLGRPERELLVQVIDRWAADVGSAQLPAGVWDLRGVLVHDLETETQ
jgi:hypothetical protein